MNVFSKKITGWYQLHKRELPWRNTSDPYRIWLSEIILQQTRVNQGLDYYIKFTKEFPAIQKLASAREERVLRLWQGLGYYSRARNLHHTAKEICRKYKGHFPDSYENLIAFKGIGEYTAAAILSIAFNKPYPVVDGNVFRVLARVFGMSTPIDSLEGKKQFNVVAVELLDRNNPGTYNQALMEFGAMYCKPVNPDCRNCCLNHMCKAYQDDTVNHLPVKSKTIRPKKRYFNYLVSYQKGKVVIRKRTANDIWKNLYDFPLIETKKQLSEKKLLSSMEWKAMTGEGPCVIRYVSEEYRHVLTHQVLVARFWEVGLTNPPKAFFRETITVPPRKLEKHAVPRLIEKYLEKRKTFFS